MHPVRMRNTKHVFRPTSSLSPEKDSRLQDWHTGWQEKVKASRAGRRDGTGQGRLGLLSMRLRYRKGKNKNASS